VHRFITFILWLLPILATAQTSQETVDPFYFKAHDAFNKEEDFLKAAVGFQKSWETTNKADSLYNFHRSLFELGRPWEAAEIYETEYLKVASEEERSTSRGHLRSLRQGNAFKMRSQAIDLYNKGKLESAKKIFKEVITKEFGTHDTMTYLYIAKIEFAKRNIEEALKFGKQADDYAIIRIHEHKTIDFLKKIKKNYGKVEFTGAHNKTKLYPPKNLNTKDKEMVEKAQKELQKNGSFEGWLPVGTYNKIGNVFTVHAKEYNKHSFTPQVSASSQPNLLPASIPTVEKTSWYENKTVGYAAVGLGTVLLGAAGYLQYDAHQKQDEAFKQRENWNRDYYQTRDDALLNQRLALGLAITGIVFESFALYNMLQ